MLPYTGVGDKGVRESAERKSKKKTGIGNERGIPITDVHTDIGYTAGLHGDEPPELPAPQCCRPKHSPKTPFSRCRQRHATQLMVLTRTSAQKPPAAPFFAELRPTTGLPKQALEAFSGSDSGASKQHTQHYKATNPQTQKEPQRRRACTHFNLTKIASMS